MSIECGPRRRPTRVTASAPGKLILCGEHAVVYRRPALVAAVDLRLRTVLEVMPAMPGGGPSVRLRVPAFGLDETVPWSEVLAYAAAVRRRWTDWSEGRSGDAFAAVRSDDPAHVMKVALGEAALDLGEAATGEANPGDAAASVLPSLVATVSSSLPTGSGFGSSAAAAVTLVAAFRALGRGLGREGRHGRGGQRPPEAGLSRGTGSHDAASGETGESPRQRGEDDRSSPRPLDLDAAELRRIEALALEVERRQHGSPSGVDGATVLHGGLVWAERDEAGALCFRPFRPHPSAVPAVLERLAVFDTGTPAEGTGAVVAAVREQATRHPDRFDGLWSAIEEATRAFRGLLESPASDDAGSRAGVLLRRCQRALEEAGVVPPAVRERVAAIEAAGGSAKVSGAGSLAGPGAGSLLVYHPGADPEGGGTLEDLPALADLHRYPVHLGGPGLTVETETTADRS